MTTNTEKLRQIISKKNTEKIKATITKKHFEGIAKVINENCLVGHDKKQILVNAFCNYFKTQNKNFNSFRFYNACMINELGSSKPETVINAVELLKKISKENKVLKSKVKCYEQDNNKRYNVPIVKTDETVNEIMEDILSIEDPQAIK